MLEDTLLPFSLLSVQRKKVTAAFDGGRMTSDGGVMLLAAVETSLGIAARLCQTASKSFQGTASKSFQLVSGVSGSVCGV